MPLIDLKSQHEVNFKLQKETIKRKCEDFLEKENNLNELVYIMTLECMHCHVLCRMKEIPFFECPICHHVWEVKEMPRGYKK